MTGNFDPARYEKLIDFLLDLKRQEAEPFSASLDALSAVLEFLNGDRRLWERDATLPLSRLHLALIDLAAGAKPMLLFESSNIRRAKGAPRHTSATILRAYVIAAFITLCAGMSRQEAAKWLAGELRRAGIKQPKGQAVELRAITRWCAERGGKSLSGADQLLADLGFPVRDTLQELRSRREKYLRDHSGYALPTPRDVKQAAAGLIKLLKITGF